ncbi:hypothetical protein BGX34_006410 [Mortierella sp. NVP85]|nr:hypothetical protein BGX34_006410 [Mortierella sp. NVP85]
MPISPTSPTAKLPGRTKQLPPSLSSVAGWNSQAPIAKSAPSPGLVLIPRQEYSSTLDFSDDDDDNVGSNGNNNNDDDDDDDDDDDNRDESDPPTITTTTAARNGGKSGLAESHPGGQNHMNNHRDDDQDNDLDDNAADWSWNLSKFKSNGGGLSNGFTMDKQEEIDWDLEEIRGGNDTPVATITSISAAVSPTTTGPPGSTLRRRSSHRKSPE